MSIILPFFTTGFDKHYESRVGVTGVLLLMKIRIKQD